MNPFRLILICVTVLLAACSKTKLPDKEALGDLAEAIQPRTADCQWFYKSLYFDHGQKYPNGSTLEEVIQVVEIEGKACYLVQLTLDYRNLAQRIMGVELSPEDYDYFWEYFDEKGSYNYEILSPSERPSSLADFQLTLPYPTEKGHKYEFEEDKWEVVSTDEVVKGPAGEFQCVVYQLTYLDVEDPEYSSRDLLYMTPGIGLVRWQYEVFEDGQWILTAQDDLISCEINL